MMKKSVRFSMVLLLGLVIVFTTNCATILNDNPQRVMVKATPAEAEIYVNDELVGTGSVEQFLTTAHEHYIKAKLGDKEKTVMINSEYGIIWIVVDVVLGLVPVVVDFITDEWKELDVPPSGEIHIDLR